MKKILRGLLLTLLVLLSLFLAAYFYIGARAEKILAELVERETGGKLKTDIDKVRFNWKQMNLTLTGSRFYSADTISEPTTYDIRVQKLVLELSALRPLLFERRLLFDTIACTRPSILVTKRKEQAREKFVLTSEMNKVYRGLSKIVNNLNIRYCVVDSGTFSLVNRVQPEHLPVSVTDLYLRIDNLRQDADSTSGKRSLFTDRIKFYSSRQDILFADGRHRLRYKRFRINSAKRYIEIDSCYFSRKTDAAGSNGLEVFVDTLRLTGVDFYGLTSTGLISADSALCINSRINLSTRLQAGTGRPVTFPNRMGRDSAAQLVKQLLGDIRIGYLGLLNAGLELRTETNGKVNSYATRRSDFIMEDIAIINHPDVPLKIGSFRFGIQGYRSFDADSNYAVRFDKIHFDNSAMEIFGFSFLPTSRNRDFNGRKAISMQALRLEGIVWSELLLNRRMVANRVTFLRPELEIHAAGLKSRAVNTSTQYNVLLRKLSQHLDAGLFIIRNASVDYQTAALLRVRFQNVNFEIRVRDLLASKGLEQTLRSFSPILFNEAELGSKSTRLSLLQGRLNTAARSLTAAAMQCSLGQGMAEGRFRNVSLNNLKEDKEGVLSVASLRWGNAVIAVNSPVRKESPGASASKRTSFVLHALEGGQTELNLHTPGLDGQMKLDRFTSGKILLQTGERPVLENLRLLGSSLVLGNGTAFRLRTGGFKIYDGDSSRLQDLSLSSNPGKIRISVDAPEFSFVPDIASLINGQHSFRRVILHNPVIALSDSNDKTSRRSGKNGKGFLPHLHLDSLHIQNPVFSEVPGAFKDKFDVGLLQSDWLLRNIRSDGGQLSLQEASFCASGISMRGDKWRFTLPGDNRLVATVNDFLFSPASVSGAASWSGVLDTLDMPRAEIRLGEDDSLFNEIGVKGIQVRNLSVKSAGKINLPGLLNDNPQFQLLVEQLSSRKSSTMLTASGLHYQNVSGELLADSLAVVPLLDRDSFNRSRTYQSDYITLKTGSIRFSGLQPGRWNPDSVFRLRQIHVDQPVLSVYKDKRLPFLGGVYKPLPTDFLQQHAKGIRIDSLHISDGDVTYEELNEKTLKNGIVRFTRLNAQLLHVAGSGHVPGDSLRLIASASLLDSIHFRLRFMQAYLDTQHTFNFAFRMSPFDMRRLNPMLAPLMSAKIKRGMLDTMRLNAFGREYLTHGKMKMYYRGLRAAYLNNGDENSRTLKTRLITFLANSIILRSSNRKGLGQVYVERKRDRSVFNYWLKIILSGVISSTGVSTNKKVEREYFRSLRQLNLPEIPDIGL